MVIAILFFCLRMYVLEHGFQIRNINYKILVSKSFMFCINFTNLENPPLLVTLIVSVTLFHASFSIRRFKAS